MSKKPSKPTEQEKPKTRYDRKMEARRKEEAREKRNELIFRCVGAVIALAVIGAIGYFGVTKFIEIKTATTDPYLTVGEHELSQVEYDYYFNTTVTNYLNTYSYYLSYIGLDLNLPFDEQQYTEDMTWQEYFEEATISQIQQEYALLDDAAANGFEYDTTEDYTTFLNNSKTAASQGQMTLGNYFKSTFGDYATQWNIKSFIENSFIASAYYEQLIEDNTPADAEVSDYYKENKDDYDTVAFYSFAFNPVTEDNTEETESEDIENDVDTEAADGAADDMEEDAENATSDADDSLSDTRKLAEEMVERLEDGEDFETLCYEYASEEEKAYYEPTDSEYSLTEGIPCSSTNTFFTEWLSDESRKNGDITILEDETLGTSYVLMFVSRTYDETCLESISTTLATEATEEYITSLIADKYEAVDVKGEISYLVKLQADSTSEDTTEESLLNTSIIE